GASFRLTGSAAMSVLVGFIAARAGNFVALRYCLLFALAVALLVAFGLTARYRRTVLSAAIRTVEDAGVSMTEIRYSAWQFRILIAWIACFAAFCVMAAVDIFIHDDEGFPGVAVLAAALGLVFMSYLGAAASGRIRRGGVLLSSQGISQRGWNFESRLDWPDIVGVKPAFNGYPMILAIGYANANWDRRYTTRFCRLDRLPPVPMIEFDCRRFDVDPRILYSYVRTYIENPELRAELGTEAALTRARQSDFAS
ncbi:hypothetical protein, partial [Mycobacterium hubeiense]|uniref:hypothetical protein n=1 Tax=Mycobacterium hubeiense TaxID=1867256 RepID=UPI001E391CA8